MASYASLQILQPLAWESNQPPAQGGSFPQPLPLTSSCLSSLAVPSTQLYSQSWGWCRARKEVERGQKESWADESTRGLECRKKTEVCSSPLVPREPQMAICEGVSRWGSLSVTEMLSQDWGKMKTSIYTKTTQESTTKSSFFLINPLINSWTILCVCVCVCVKGGGTARGGLDGAGAEVEGMWRVREEPHQSQACYL